MITKTGATILATHDVTQAMGRIRCYVHILRISGVLAGLAEQLEYRQMKEFGIVKWYACRFCLVGSTDTPAALMGC
jgi:hypothetical protein